MFDDEASLKNMNFAFEENSSETFTDHRGRENYESPVVARPPFIDRSGALGLSSSLKPAFEVTTFNVDSTTSALSDFGHSMCSPFDLRPQAIGRYYNFIKMDKDKHSRIIFRSLGCDCPNQSVEKAGPVFYCERRCSSFSSAALSRCSIRFREVRAIRRMRALRLKRTNRKEIVHSSHHSDGKPTIFLSVDQLLTRPATSGKFSAHFTMRSMNLKV